MEFKDLPNWPFGLPLNMASKFVGLGKDTFLKLVENGDVPPPVWLSQGRKVWIREELEDWLREKGE